MILRKLRVAALSATVLLSACSFSVYKHEVKTIPLSKDVDLILAGTASEGDIRPGMTADRAFLLQKDADGNTIEIRHVDSGFASENSLKNVLTAGPATVAVQGGLNYATAGQFKVPKYNSNSNVSMTSGPIDVNQEQRSSNSANQNNENRAYGGSATANPTANGGSVRDFSVTGGNPTANGGSVRDFSVGGPGAGHGSGPPKNRPPDNRPPYNRPPTKGWSH